MLILFIQIFKANYDRYTVVKNVLDEPIITRFIRIHPETWNGHISMRTEFYGCKKGILELFASSLEIMAIVTSCYLRHNRKELIKEDSDFDWGY